jgi:hypothetical protein
MGVLNWSRLDANIATNHKTLALLGMKGGEHAMLVGIFAHGYCTGHGTDGFIPKAALGTFHGNAKDALMLVDVGLWEAVDGGWLVHDWAEYQPTTEENQNRSQRARAAAQKRWGTGVGNA